VAHCCCGVGNMARSPDMATRGASSRHRPRWRAAGFFVVVMLALAGIGTLVLAQGQDQGRLMPPAPATAAGPTRTAEPAQTPTQLISLTRSEPVEVRIPKIGVKAEVINVGL